MSAPLNKKSRRSHGAVDVKEKESIMSSVGDGLNAQNANWSFANDTAKNFDSHVQKSVPLYNEGQELICDLSDYFIKNDSIAYDVGTSTGAIPLKLASHNKHKTGARFIGLDVIPDMIDLANAKKMAACADNVEFVVEDILQFPFEFERLDMITAYYTIQFIRPSQRQAIVNKFYQSLKWGGAFVMFEKVRANDARFQDIMSGIYNEYKLHQGYSPEEIFHKTRSLKGVLEPFSSQANIDMLKRAGFVDIIPIMKFVCFEGFLAIK